MRSFNLHYDSGVTPWLTISTIYALFYIKKLLSRVAITQKFATHLLYLVSCVVLFFAARFNYHYSPLPTTPSCWCFMYEQTEADKEFEKAPQKIPENASVTASPEIRPHTTDRMMAFTLPAATDSADSIAIIDQNRILGEYEPKDFELRLIEILDREKKYELVKKVDHLFLYKKKTFKGGDF